MSAALCWQVATSPFELDPAPHWVASAAMMGVVGLAEAAVNPALKGGFDCLLSKTQDRCDSSSLWGFDSVVLGQRSLAWRRISDAGMLTATLAPFGLAFWDNRDDGWSAARLDLTVAVESLSVATFVSHIWKYAVRRPRPGLYTPGNPTVQGHLSFPSGHTAATVAACTSYTTTFFLHYPTSPWRWAVLSGAVAVSGLTAYGRLAGGMHFTSDVTAGALLGGAVGFVVPWVLRRPDWRVGIGPAGTLDVTVVL